MCLREASDIGVAHAFKRRAQDIKPSVQAAAWAANMS